MIHRPGCRILEKKIRQFMHNWNECIWRRTDASENIVSEHDQEMPQLQSADKPMAPQE